MMLLIAKFFYSNRHDNCMKSNEKRKIHGNIL